MDDITLGYSILSQDIFHRYPIQFYDIYIYKYIYVMYTIYICIKFEIICIGTRGIFSFRWTIISNSKVSLSKFDGK